MRSFSQWKTEAVLRLLEINAKHRDQRVQETVNVLLTKLHYLRVRDLSSFLVLVYHAANLTEEFLHLLPSQEEVREWFERGEEG